jgi:23S rRNA (cytidine2498-2'-O)-methyltransferase
LIFIATARPEFWGAAMTELGRPAEVDELRDDIRRVVLREPLTSTPIFVHHLFPVQATVPVDADAIADAVRDRVDRSKTLGIQVRTVAGARTGRAILAAAIGDRLDAEIDLQHAELIVSVLAGRETADVGVSTPEENLSAWSGGERRFKRYDGQINRAEFKLLEAFDVFGIDPSNFRTALDLGAAPGGWTNVLVSAGCRVVAVDPGSLDERLMLRPDVRHMRSTIGEFERSNPRERFDLVVNDMRMDARMSARAQVSIASYLAAGGTAVITLKIGRRAPLAEVRNALRILEKTYVVRGVRQLFHNRGEVTAALSKR